MTIQQLNAIQTMNNDKLLEIYNSYYIKVTRELIPDNETADIFYALKQEILERMAR